MRCARVTMAAAVAGIVLAGCGDSPESSSLTSPEFKPAPPGFTCDFGYAAGLVRSYYAQPTQNIVVGLIDQMAASSQPTRTARGFDVFQYVAAGADVEGTVEVGSDLLNAVGACMRVGQTAKIDYTEALGPHGALEVRGATSDPVRAADDFSGVAPPLGETWSQWLGLPAPSSNATRDLPDPRALVYGAPFDVTNDLSPEAEVGTRGFDWNTLPVAPNFPLNGDGFLALCVGSDDRDRIQNNHVQNGTLIPGILGTAASSPFALNCNNFGDNGQILASGLVRRVMDVFLPAPLHAAALGKRTIGTPGGFSKQFVVALEAVNMTFGPLSDGLVGQTIKPFQVTATSGSGVPMQRIGITISARTNNGVPANLQGTVVQITNEFGVATFDDLVLNSAGGYNWHATTSAGTDGIIDQPAEKTSAAFHIKNKKGGR